MVELDIVRFLCYNKNYNTYNTYIDKTYINTNYPILIRIINSLGTYFSKYPNREECTKEELEVSYLANYPVTKEIQRKELSDVLNRIFQSTVSNEQIEELLEAHRLRAKANSIAILAVEVAEGRKTAQELVESVKSIGIAQTLSDAAKPVTSDLEAIYEHVVRKQGLRWRLDWLNKSLGSLRKGDFGFAFSRPETGKTTFLADQTTFMAGQMEDDYEVLWFNNEEQGEKVMLRCYSAALGRTAGDIFRNRRDSMAEYQHLTGDRIHIFDEASINQKYVEKILSSRKAGLIIFDQIDKLKGFDNDRDDLELGAIYQWAREIAKEYAPVIAICQADGTGENQKWLHMGHVSRAKTSKQGEADWILGIGKIYDEGMQDVRFFNISKNKLIGDEDSVPEFRHGKYSCILEADIARYRAP